MAKTQPLAWFPINADEWTSRVAVLPLESVGALFVAVVHGWNAAHRGAAPGTLPASEEGLARLFGPAWDRVRSVVLAEFVADPAAPDVLRCGWLADLYETQAAKHAAVVEKARKGGWKKGRARKPKTDAAPAGPVASSAPTGAEAIPGAVPGVLLGQTEGDPSGSSYGRHQKGGRSAPDPSRGSGSIGPDAGAAPDEPAPVALEAALAWVESEPKLRRSIEREVDAHLDAENDGWRTRPMGAGLRNRFVELRIREAYGRHLRGLEPVPLSAVVA